MRLCKHGAGTGAVDVNSHGASPPHNGRRLASVGGVDVCSLQGKLTARCRFGSDSQWMLTLGFNSRMNVSCSSESCLFPAAWNQWFCEPSLVGSHQGPSPHVLVS